MRLITRITQLRNTGVFRNFTWPDGLSEFGKYNLIYGWNGTGKTTLSRLLRDIELRRLPTQGDVVLRVDDKDIQGKDFPQSTLAIRVFNRDFVRESVFRTNGGDVPPIFVVGKESIEKQKEVDKLKLALRTKEDELDKARENQKQAEKDLDGHCIDRAKVIKETLRATGSEYNEYDKRRYKERAEKMAEAGDAAKQLLSDSERERLQARHRATRKPKVSDVAYRVPQLQDLANIVAQLLGRTVVSAAIQTLKNDSDLAEWTRHGLGLHKKRGSDKCLFCEQPLPKGRLGELEAHFNAEYERFLQTVESQIQQLESEKKQAAELRLPNRAELYDDLAKEFNAAEETFRKMLGEITKFLDDLINALKHKKDKAFEAQTLNVAAPSVDDAVIKRLGEVIAKHNQSCDRFDESVKDARDRLALDMIAESLDEFVRLKDAVEKVTGEIQSIQNAITGLKNQIAQLERDIKEHQRPAEDLNEDLKRYLGHSDLQLTIKETGYAITRNGAPADMLSEGEMTAIALLYFLKSLEDRGFDKANGVVVLDDPVSSLDANALYLAFGFIRQRTQDAGQLLILTHNFTFFRQVRNWFHHLKGQKKKVVSQRPARFYMLDCIRDSKHRCSSIRPLDPLLEEYESEYHYLFALIYRAAEAPSPETLEQNYILPNVARRFLEAFLAFRQPQVAGDLWQKLQNVDFDAAKKHRIIRFVHTHSHGDTIGEPGHDPSLLGEARMVLGDLLEFIKSQDTKHFEGMVAVVKPPNDAEGDE